MPDTHRQEYRITSHSHRVLALHWIWAGSRKTHTLGATPGVSAQSAPNLLAATPHMHACLPPSHDYAYAGRMVRKVYCNTFSFLEKCLVFSENTEKCTVTRFGFI
jgi:hypothetical protein